MPAAPVSTHSWVVVRQGVGYHMEGRYSALEAFPASPRLSFMTVLQGRTQSPHFTMARLIQCHPREGTSRGELIPSNSRMRKYYDIKNILCKEPYALLHFEI